MIFDAHCDVLYRLQNEKDLHFSKSGPLHVTYQELKNAGAKVQCFAIFLSPSLPPSRRFEAALEQVDLFYERIVKPHADIQVITSKRDIQNLKEHEIGVVLTLEGCEAIQEDLMKLRTLKRLGVCSVGLTWNYANTLADGAMESRGAGLTAFGRQVVEELNQMKIWTDVSHLSEKAFWDVLELADYPVASHSNSYSLCPHPRNLKDDQIKALIQKNSVIGLTFVPFFVKDHPKPSIADFLQHVDYVCGLGGEFHLGFGSDFDGIDETIPGLDSFQGYLQLAELLDKHYSASQVENFLYHNFVRYFPD
ncbi:membrane dipeptidase [Bacillus ectoiniformans]|uniref:dipeptidase n=1 Tax=Bacillus ectoiniformans TaxID=1494429 RepID=UPI00195607B7|nr:dipeptidase [Bacillus ectoiniformans]MBM7650082.1 membrane dipeptidase [Bacillus ectoiniformans]